MFGEPLTHLVIGPIPLKGMRVPLIILRPGDFQVLQKLLPTTPGITLQLAPAECPDEHFRLIQPRGVDRGKTGPPPAAMVREVLVRRGSGVTGIAILNPEAPCQKAMAAAKILQGLGVVGA